MRCFVENTSKAEIGMIFCGTQAQEIGINYQFLIAAIDQQGPWQGQNVQVDLDWCLSKLDDVVRSIDWKATALDVRRFVRVAEQPSLDLWSKDLFLAQLEKLK